MKIFILLLLYLLKLSFGIKAQHVEILSKGIASSIRGLSVVDDKVVWVSGSNGMVGRSINGGADWKWLTVKNLGKRDFRDIEAFCKDTAIIMAIAAPAIILKTTDGGETWRIVYENKLSGMFLDAMEFFNTNSGIVLGDPVNGKFFVARTFDKGETWTETVDATLPAADSGEACFASSGTNIRKLFKEEFCFVSGGMKSHYITNRSSILLPFVQGTGSTGANSIAVRKDNKYLVVVGGDYSRDTIVTNNCFISSDAGKTWIAPVISPHGYRSCVEFLSPQQVITCGTSGVDLSDDSGMNWRLLSRESFHVCRKARIGTAVFFAGGGGRIGKLVFDN